MLFKISEGWPPTVPPQFETSRPDKFYLDRVRDTLDRERFQSKMYNFMGESRDIDYETLRKYLNWSQKWRNNDRIPTASTADGGMHYMQSIVKELAREGSDEVT